MSLTQGRGVDVIQDPIVGGPHFKNLSCLSMDARWVLYGSMGGIKVENANMAKLLMKRASLISTTLRNRTDPYKANLL